MPPGTYPPNVNRGLDQLAIEGFHWGFKRKWAKDDAPRPINARAEKVAERPYFRHAFARQRCLVPANGWFEWKRNGTAKVPHYLTHQEDALLFFAGIYELGDETVEPSFAIITHPAADAFQSIHDRMPLVLDPLCWKAWLDPALEERAEIRATMHPLDPNKLHAYPVSTAINNPKNDYPELLERIVPPDD